MGHCGSEIIDRGHDAAPSLSMNHRIVFAFVESRGSVSLNLSSATSTPLISPTPLSFLVLTSPNDFFQPAQRATPPIARVRQEAPGDPSPLVLRGHEPEPIPHRLHPKGPEREGNTMNYRQRAPFPTPRGFGQFFELA